MDTVIWLSPIITNTSNQELFFSRFSSNSKVNAAEFLDYLEKLFPWYYMNSNVFNKFKSHSLVCYSSEKDQLLSLCNTMKYWVRYIQDYARSTNGFLYISCSFKIFFFCVTKQLRRMFHFPDFLKNLKETSENYGRMTERTLLK